MSTAATAEQYHFVRRTSLNQDEYRKNFRQIDRDVIEALTSPEADQVTSQMSKIYLRLSNASQECWERQGVLRFTGCEREGKFLTAWEQLVSLAGVASATARKALSWMSQQGIIGYYAGKNGVGIRIFFNRAASSIGQRPSQGQKNLRLIRASTGDSRTSFGEAGFKESHADIENLELDSLPQAPKDGAADVNTERNLAGSNLTAQHSSVTTIHMIGIASDEIIERIAKQVLPQVRSAAAREQERTREWFIKDALPKAIRVAQRSAYDVLRANGAINESRTRGSRSTYGHFNDREVGKHAGSEIAPRRLSDGEVEELAESCVALLVTQGQAIDCTLTEMSVDVGGFLLPEDVSKVRTRAAALTCKRSVTQNSGREN
jgi:hypothetical protein